MVSIFQHAIKFEYRFLAEQKTVSEVLKRGIFLILPFVRKANGRATAPPAFTFEYITIRALNRHGSVL